MHSNNSDLILVGVYLAMFFCNVWPRKTWYPLAIGTAIEALGITVLAVALTQGNIPTIYGMLALTGCGSGLRFMPGKHAKTVSNITAF